MISTIKPIGRNSSPIHIKESGNQILLMINGDKGDLQFINTNGSNITKIINDEDVVISKGTFDEWISLFRTNSILTKYVIAGGSIVVRVDESYQLTNSNKRGMYYESESGLLPIQYEEKDGYLRDLTYAGSISNLKTPAYTYSQVANDLKSIKTKIDDLNIATLESDNKTTELLPKGHISDYVSFENSEYNISPGGVLEFVIGYAYSDAVLNWVKYEDRKLMYDDLYILYGDTGIHTTSGNILVPSGDKVYRKLIGDMLLEVTSERLVVYSTNPTIKEYIIKSCRIYDY